MAETFSTKPFVHRRAVAPTTAAPGALPEVAAIDKAAWCDLATRVIEPNGYYLPEWVIAANGDDAVPRALTAQDSAGRLIGVLPVISCWRAFHLPLPALVMPPQRRRRPPCRQQPFQQQLFQQQPYQRQHVQQPLSHQQPS